MAKIRFYFDEMMPKQVAEQLEKRGYEVVRAVLVGMTKKDDLTEHLTYATENRLVVATCDRPFANRATSILDHSGLVCWNGNQDDIGGMVKAFAKFAEEHASEEVIGRVFWYK